MPNSAEMENNVNIDKVSSEASTAHGKVSPVEEKHKQDNNISDKRLTSSPWHGEYESMHEWLEAEKKWHKENIKDPYYNTNINATEGSLAYRMGEWAFKHKKDFTDNKVAWYGLRTGINSAVGLVALTAVIAPVRSGMALMAKAAGKQKFTGAARVDKFIESVAGENVIQMMTGVGLSFATYRTILNAGKANYDRIFTDAESVEDSARAIRNLPNNWLHEFGKIAKYEYPATMVAAIPLVAIRGGISAVGKREASKLNPKVDTPLPGGPGQDSNWRDALGCIPAYTVFFEVADRLGQSFNTSNYEIERMKVLPHHQKKGDDGRIPERPWIAEFTEDTPTSLLFKRVGSVTAGIIPYIFLNREQYARQGARNIAKMPGESRSVSQIMKEVPMRERIRLGGMQPGVGEGFIESFKKEFKPYQWFTVYPIISEVYKDKYDKIFSDLQEKYESQQKTRG